MIFPDLLAKFPPNSVKMKQPFGTQPWDSSPETVKKLFKVNREDYCLINNVLLFPLAMLFGLCVVCQMGPPMFNLLDEVDAICTNYASQLLIMLISHVIKFCFKC